MLHLQVGIPYFTYLQEHHYVTLCVPSVLINLCRVPSLDLLKFFVLLFFLFVACRYRVILFQTFLRFIIVNNRKLPHSSLDVFHSFMWYLYKPPSPEFHLLFRSRIPDSTFGQTTQTHSCSSNDTDLSPHKPRILPIF